jgi:hypothetical protein
MLCALSKNLGALNSCVIEKTGDSSHNADKVKRSERGGVIETKTRSLTRCVAVDIRLPMLMKEKHFPLQKTSPKPQKENRNASELRLATNKHGTQSKGSWQCK